jgi:hypothetical protein
MMETFEKKQTKWEGLWWHPEYNGFSSAVINLAKLKAFKGNVRMYVRKNKYFNGGENDRPNYLFCIKDANSDIFKEVDIEEEPKKCRYDSEQECYLDEEDNRLYTRDEVRTIINGTVSDVEYGIHDPYDILPEDFV